MNRWPAVALISILTLVFFGFLVRYGWTRRYGPPDKVPVEPPADLAVPFADRELELRAEDLRGAFWSDKPIVALPLIQQATSLPWAREHTPEARVQAFHNGREIYVRVEWDSDGPDREHAPGRFPDACAVAVPIPEDVPPESILMGFGGMTNFWHWKADVDAEVWDAQEPGAEAYADRHYPFDEEEVLSVSRTERESAAEDTLAAAPGSLTRKERQLVQARGTWEDGVWSVVFKRALRTDDAERDAQFARDRRPVAFAVWEGARGERGGRKSISGWVILNLAPAAAETDGAPGLSLLVPGAGETDAGIPVRVGGLSAAEAEKEPKLFEICARRFEYKPNRFTVQKGDVVTLRLESMDVTHGLYLDGYGVELSARPGRASRATFVADRTGRFSFRCSVTCGEFHPYMIGFLTVEPNTRFRTFLAAAAAVFVVLGAGVFFARTRGRAE